MILSKQDMLDINAGGVITIHLINAGIRKLAYMVVSTLKKKIR
jgi:hypothetical protein